MRGAQFLAIASSPGQQNLLKYTPFFRVQLGAPHTGGVIKTAIYLFHALVTLVTPLHHKLNCMVPGKLGLHLLYTFLCNPETNTHSKFNSSVST